MSEFKLKDKVLISDCGKLYAGIIVGLHFNGNCCIATAKGFEVIPGSWGCQTHDWLNEQLIKNNYTCLDFLTEEEFKDLNIVHGYFVPGKKIIKRLYYITVEEMVASINNELNI